MCYLLVFYGFLASSMTSAALTALTVHAYRRIKRKDILCRDQSDTRYQPGSDKRSAAGLYIVTEKHTVLERSYSAGNLPDLNTPYPITFTKAAKMLHDLPPSLSATISNDPLL
jgi:hypothetical protein